MEGPITFDLWGWPDPAHKMDVLHALSTTRPEATHREVLQAIARKQPILIAENLGWKDVQALQSSLPSAWLDTRVFQSGYGPADQAVLRQCLVHQIYYAGVLGCPVCDRRDLKTST